MGYDYLETRNYNLYPTNILYVNKILSYCGLTNIYYYDKLQKIKTIQKFYKKYLLRKKLVSLSKSDIFLSLYYHPDSKAVYFVKNKFIQKQTKL